MSNIIRNGLLDRPAVVDNPLRTKKAYSNTLLFATLAAMPYGAPTPQPTTEKSVQAPCHSIPKKQYLRAKKKRKSAAQSRRKNR